MALGLESPHLPTNVLLPGLPNVIQCGRFCFQLCNTPLEVPLLFPQFGSSSGLSVLLTLIDLAGLSLTKGRRERPIDGTEDGVDQRSAASACALSSPPPLSSFFPLAAPLHLLPVRAAPPVGTASIQLPPEQWPVTKFWPLRHLVTRFPLPASPLSVCAIPVLHFLLFQLQILIFFSVFN